MAARRRCSTTEVSVVKIAIQKHFYRSGQVREQIPMRNGQRHGVISTWHKNGQLATQEPFQSGLLHGVCCQWDEKGQLLGAYEMNHGTGIQRSWHDNGQLQSEVSTLDGEFCGRNRLWLRDGTLLSEHFYLFGRNVSAETYHAAAAKDKTLPRVRGRVAKLPLKNKAMARLIHRVFISSLLKKQDRTEARGWLQKTADDKIERWLGRKPAGRAAQSGTAKFLNDLYRAGAAAVIVSDIYCNKRGQQFADYLVVCLPTNVEKRQAIRTVCEQLRKGQRGAVEPNKDIGENHLYLFLA